MKLHPILYSTPMVQAILDDRKNQTRRLTGLEFINQNPEQWEFARYPNINEGIKEGTTIEGALFDCLKTGDDITIACPYGQPGDVLWVRESFYAYGIWRKVFNVKKEKFVWEFTDMTNSMGYDYHYEASLQEGDIEIATHRNEIEGWYKRPSLFMPRHACRTYLKVKSIRVERIQDIIDGDAVAEGIEFIKGNGGVGYKNYLVENQLCAPEASFMSLWQKINGYESWQANPWVWVIEFEKTEKPQ